MVDMSDLNAWAHSSQRSRNSATDRVETTLGSGIGKGLREALEGGGISKIARELSKIEDAMKDALKGPHLQDTLRGFATMDREMKDILSGLNFGQTIGDLSTIENATKPYEQVRTFIDQTTASGRALQHAYEGYERLADTGRFGKDLSDKFADLDLAINGLAEAGSNLGSFDKLLEYSTRRDGSEGHLEFLEPLPNPLFETNEHLEKLTADIEEIRAVSTATANVQEKQAALIAQLLTAIAEGSAAQEKAASETLRVAKVSMWISLVAVVLMFAGVGAQALLG